MAIASYVLGVAFLGVLVTLAFKLVSMIKPYRRSRAMLKQLPQSPANLIFGHLFEYPGPDEKGLEFQREMTAAFPRSQLVWMMNFPMYIVSHPDTVKVILKTSEPKGRRVYNLIRPWIGDGLLTSKGTKWARNRRLLTPAFHFEILKNYIELKNRSADILLGKFQQAAATNQPFKTFANITMFTLDVILKCAMSYETDCQNLGEKHPYVNGVNAMSEILVDRFFKPWLHSDFIFFLTPAGRRFKKHCQFVHNVALDIIDKRRNTLAQESAALENKGEKRRRCLDFLDILLTAKDENGCGLTNDEIRDEVDTFLFEGHDTTASAISWALYSIAEHEDVQMRIQEELDAILADRDDKDVLWEDLAHLPYLTMVIKESMRLHSPVPFIQRELTVDTEIDGKMVPAGTTINIVIYNIHHNATVWGDTMKFDPDRFLPENTEKRDPFAFIPFSAGPRNCIGQTFAMDEIKIALGRILYKFRLKLDPNFTTRHAESIVMRSENDIQLIISER